MAWRWTGDKPLSEPMMSQFNDAYASLGLNELNSNLETNYVLTNYFANKLILDS